MKLNRAVSSLRTFFSELLIPACINLDMEGPRGAWFNEDLLLKVKNKKKMHRQRNQKCVPGEEYRNTIHLCENSVRKDKTQLEKRRLQGELIVTFHDVKRIL